MGKGKTLFIAAAAVSLAVGAKQLFTKSAERLKDSFTVNIPLEKIHPKWSILKSVIYASLEVNNHSYLPIKVENLRATVSFITDTGQLREIARTAPTPKSYMINKSSTSLIELPGITISHTSLLFSASDIIKALQANTPNKFQIEISGFANGFEFNTIQKY